MLCSFGRVFKELGSPSLISRWQAPARDTDGPGMPESPEPRGILGFTSPRQKSGPRRLYCPFSRLWPRRAPPRLLFQASRLGRTACSQWNRRTGQIPLSCHRQIGRWPPMNIGLKALERLEPVPKALLDNFRQPRTAFEPGTGRSASGSGTAPSAPFRPLAVLIGTSEGGKLLDDPAQNLPTATGRLTRINAASY